MKIKIRESNQIYSVAMIYWVGSEKYVLTQDSRGQFFNVNYSSVEIIDNSFCGEIYFHCKDHLDVLCTSATFNLTARAGKSVDNLTETDVLRYRKMVVCDSIKCILFKLITSNLTPKEIIIEIRNLQFDYYSLFDQTYLDECLRISEDAMFLNNLDEQENLIIFALRQLLKKTVLCT